MNSIEMLKLGMGVRLTKSQAAEASNELVNLQKRITELEAQLKERDELAATVERLRETWQSVGGCGDHSCYLLKPEGMGTNGSCRCYGNRSKMMTLTQRMNAVFQQSPHQNLNAVKREVVKRAIVEFGLVADTRLCDENDLIQLGEEYANETYPDKDGES